MAPRRQQIASELQVLQQAVASAVHELSQPLNVVNLLADNALEDVAVLQAAAGGDPAVLGALRRRVEAIIEQAGKASDITRWVRAFAVGVGAEVADFDPDGVVQRLVGIFTNDLNVAGVRLVAQACAAGQRLAVGDEALFGFALTEVVLWMSATLPRMAGTDVADDGCDREIRILCEDEQSTRCVVVTIAGAAISTAAAAVELTATPPADTGRDGTVPAALPLLALAGRARGSSVAVTRTAGGGVRVRLTLPRGTDPEGFWSESQQ
jgi:hypothetical protein